MKIDVYVEALGRCADDRGYGMKTVLGRLGISVAVAIALAPFSVLVSAPAHAICSIGINGNWVCENGPDSITAPVQSDNCDNHVWNTCPYCKDVGKTYPQPQQPVLPCDHSKYE